MPNMTEQLAAALRKVLPYAECEVSERSELAESDQEIRAADGYQAEVAAATEVLQRFDAGER